MSTRAFIFALFMAVLGTVLLFLYQRKFELETSGGERVRVLLVVKTVERGTIITEDALSTRDVPQAYFEDRMIREAEKSKILGLRIGNTVRAQQTVMWTDLITAVDERRDLSSLIQPGSRAISISGDRADTNFALIRPGDYVDVISMLPVGTSDQRASSVILQKVLVLATGTDLSAEPRANQNRNDMLLTLSVSVQEAQLLGLVMGKGRLMFTVRSPDDPKVVDKLPDIVSTAIVDSKERGQIKGVRGGPTRVPENAIP